VERQEVDSVTCSASKLFSKSKAKSTATVLLLSFLLGSPALQLVLAAPKATVAASAVAASVPDFGAFESYATRPDILALTPQEHPELGGDWQKLKRGHLEAVAQMVGLYPDRELYFLARDSELLYDLARFYFKDDSGALSRIHLLNASRLNMRADHVREYLKQEGISEAGLRGGLQVVFIDTGFSGTIPRVLSEYFPAELGSKLQTHLLSSSNPRHPSSRVFLTSINPAAPAMNPGTLHGSVVSYEHLPRFTDRSSHFRQDTAGRWHPVSPKSAAGDGTVSRERARAYQEDLLAFARTNEAQAHFKARFSQWREMRGMLDAGDGAGLEVKLRELLAA